MRMEVEMWMEVEVQVLVKLQVQVQVVHLHGHGGAHGELHCLPQLAGQGGDVALPRHGGLAQARDQVPAPGLAPRLAQG